MAIRSLPSGAWESNRWAAPLCQPPRRLRSPVPGPILGAEAGGGRSPRQPGQVRKEAAVTSFASGRRPVSTCARTPPARAGGPPIPDARLTARPRCPSQPAEPPASPTGSRRRAPTRCWRASTGRAPSDLIGQEALVRTLTNAFATGRHRPRLHAHRRPRRRQDDHRAHPRPRAELIEPDGQGQPTPDPAAMCEHCGAIAEGRHIDVLEMDAATRTGIDDIREILDSVRYAPAAARYKVYIIDEVHMLSKEAFNALLKTLEEPPPHAKFIFATTEIRKVPVTVLSRCQRFDLRRIERERAGRAIWRGIARQGAGRRSSPTALALIARAAEGSVRDGLSLLDQAIALAGGDGGRRSRRSGARHAGPRRPRAASSTCSSRSCGATSGRRWTALASSTSWAPIPERWCRTCLRSAHWLTRIKVAPERPTRFGVAAAGRGARPAHGRAALERRCWRGPGRCCSRVWTMCALRRARCPLPRW